MTTVDHGWDPRQMHLAVLLHELVCADPRSHGWLNCPESGAITEAAVAAWEVLRLRKPKDLNAEVDRLLG